MKVTDLRIGNLANIIDEPNTKNIFIANEAITSIEFVN